MKKILHRLTCLPHTLLLALVVLAACNQEEETPPRPTDDLLEVIADTDGLDSLEQVLEDFTGLSERISTGEFTVFAPSDAAFRELLETLRLETVDEIDPGLLSDIILYHLVANNLLNQNQLSSELTTLNVNADPIIFTQEDSLLLNEGTQPGRTTIVTPNIQAANGVIHIINQVLLPPDIAALAPSFGTLAGLTATLSLGGEQFALNTINTVFNIADLQGALSSSNTYTVLAPVNQAFELFSFTSQQNVVEVANYHVLEGDVDFANAGRTVSTLAGEPLYVTNFENTTFLNGIPFFDIGYTASNGKILFSGLAAQPTRGVLKPPVPLDDLLDYIENTTGASINIFREAFATSGITVGEDKTILIPTDEAFQAAGIITTLDTTGTSSTARLEPAFLANILNAHVLDGMYFSADVLAASSVTVPNANAASVTVALDEDAGVITVTAGGEQARVIYFDALAEGGVVHLIDQVLAP